MAQVLGFLSSVAMVVFHLFFCKYFARVAYGWWPCWFDILLLPFVVIYLLLFCYTDLFIFFIYYFLFIIIFFAFGWRNFWHGLWVVAVSSLLWFDLGNGTSNLGLSKIMASGVVTHKLLLALMQVLLMLT